MKITNFSKQSDTNLLNILDLAYFLKIIFFHNL